MGLKKLIDEYVVNGVGFNKGLNILKPHERRSLYESVEILENLQKHNLTVEKVHFRNIQAKMFKLFYPSGDARRYQDGRNHELEHFLLSLPRAFDAMIERKTNR